MDVGCSEDGDGFNGLNIMRSNIVWYPGWDLSWWSEENQSL